MTMERAALGMIAIRLRWAARFNGISRIQLISADPAVDVSALARCLDALLADRPIPLPAPDLPPVVVQVRPFTDGGEVEGTQTAFVLVAPDRVRKGALDPLRDLQTITGWPLVGVISYPHRRFWQRRVRPLVSQFHVAGSGPALYDRFWNRRKSPNGRLTDPTPGANLSVVTDTAGTAS